jgi:hypothetical protein
MINFAVMRILSTIFLLAVLLSKTIYSVFWQVNFQLNQKEIVRMECENRNRPELHCNGKCYLAKQLQKADNLLDERREESSKSLVNLKWMETSLFACPETIVMKLDQSTISLNETSNFNVVNFYHFENSLSCFHPPCA